MNKYINGNIMSCKSILFLLLFALPLAGKAQFYTQGEITYQRTFNLKLATQLEKRFEWVSRFAKDMPDDVKSYFSLRFNLQKTDYIFLPDSSTDTQKNRFVNFLPVKRIAYDNQVQTDLANRTQKALKKVFEQNFLISDSLPEYKWKIEDNIRSIAGYPCRKATTTINDSVVVVAFYTDQIMVSGGPESFNGLPGMILGLAIPRLYTTWFATKVSVSAPQFPPITLPKKTDKVNWKGFMEKITKVTKSAGGDDAAFFIWRSTL